MLKRKRNELSAINYLELTPTRSYEDMTEENGMLSILIPRFANKILVKLIVPMLKSPYVKVKLDEFGSEVWRQIDGKKNVQEIADILKMKFGEKIEPVGERLTNYLTQIHRYNFISFNEIKK